MNTAVAADWPPGYRINPNPMTDARSSTLLRQRCCRTRCQPKAAIHLTQQQYPAVTDQIAARKRRFNPAMTDSTHQHRFDGTLWHRQTPFG